MRLKPGHILGLTADLGPHRIDLLQGRLRPRVLLRHETPGPEEAARRIGTEQGVHILKIAHGGAMGRLAYARIFGSPLGEGEDLILMCYTSKDFREGMEAFLAKRPARWQGE